MKEYVLQQKRAVVDEIKEKIQKADAIVLMEYRGLTVEHATDLRNKFRQANVDYKVYKNTMMEFAFKAALPKHFKTNGKFIRKLYIIINKIRPAGRCLMDNINW